MKTTNIYLFLYKIHFPIRWREIIFKLIENLLFKCLAKSCDTIINKMKICFILLAFMLLARISVNVTCNGSLTNCAACASDANDCTTCATGYHTIGSTAHTCAQNTVTDCLTYE